MGFPLRHIVQHRAYTMGENGMGDPTPVLGDPVDLRVIGWYITGGTETGSDGHINQVEYDAVVLAPSSAQVSPHDQIIIDGRPFEVDAPPGDWNHGPWWDPQALQIKLKAVE